MRYGFYLTKDEETYHVKLKTMDELICFVSFFNKNTDLKMHHSADESWWTNIPKNPIRKINLKNNWSDNSKWSLSFYCEHDYNNFINVIKEIPKVTIVKDISSDKEVYEDTLLDNVEELSKKLYSINSLVGKMKKELDLLGNIIINRRKNGRSK